MRKILLPVFFLSLFMFFNEGCNRQPIPLPEHPPMFNSILVSPSTENLGKYTTIVGSYIQFLVDAGDSDRIDTGFTYQWSSDCGGVFKDTFGNNVPSDSAVRLNVVRWYPNNPIDKGYISIIIYDQRGEPKDTSIPVSVLPYEFQGEIVDSSLQEPTGIGVSSGNVAVVDAKNHAVNIYSTSNNALLYTLSIPEKLDSMDVGDLSDVVFDEYGRMFISTSNMVLRYAPSGDTFVFDKMNTNITDGRYFHYNMGKLYLTVSSGYDLFTVVDTSLDTVYMTVSGNASVSGSPRGGITTDSLGRRIYLLYTDMTGTPYLRVYNEVGSPVIDNYFADSIIPDSSYFYSIFYLNYYLYIGGVSPGWVGIYKANPNQQVLLSKWGDGGAEGPDRFQLILDAAVEGDTFYLLDPGNKAIRYYTEIK